MRFRSVCTMAYITPIIMVTVPTQMRPMPQLGCQGPWNPGMEGELDGFGYQGGQHEEEDAAGEGVRDGWISPEGAAGAEVDDEDGGQQTVAGYMGHQQDFAGTADG